MTVVFHLRDGRRVFDHNGDPDVALEILGGVLRQTDHNVVFHADDGLLKFACRDVTRIEIDI